MPYKPTGKAPGRPLADPVQEAERQRKWEEKKRQRAEAKKAEVSTPPPARGEPRSEKVAKPDKFRRQRRDPKRKTVFGSTVSTPVEKPYIPTFGYRAPSRVEKHMLRPLPTQGG